MTEVSTFQELVSEKLKSLARNLPYEPSPLTLNIVKANPLELNDSNNVVLKHDGDYQAKLRTLEPNDKVTVQNYDVHVKWEKHEVATVRIHFKELNYGGKKITGLDLSFQLENVGNKLVNEAGVGFVNRIRKSETAIKFSDVQFNTLVSDQDQKDALKQRKAKANVHLMEVESEDLELDETSLKHLKKLKKVINRSDLFNLMVKKGVKDGAAKKTVRHMIFPDQDSKANKDPLFYQKKTYSRSLISELLDEYKN